jgi:hypothetical protein
MYLCAKIAYQSSNGFCNGTDLPFVHGCGNDRGQSKMIAADQNLDQPKSAILIPYSHGHCQESYGVNGKVN